MRKTNDLRVIKTKQLLKNALLTLIEEKGMENITVRKLTEYAQINRSTFYAHFYDKYHLLESMISEELLSFVEEAAPKSEEELIAPHSPKTFYLRAAQYIYQHADFFKVMMGENGIPSFQQQFLQIMKRYMMDRLDKFHPQLDNMKIPKEFFISYVAHANVGVILYWLESNLQYSPEYMAEKMANMTMEGPLSVAGIKKIRE